MLDPHIVSLEDVARQAGVSAGTASKVLNGRYRFESPAAARVLAVAAELNYQPDPAASHLRRRVTDRSRRKELIPIVSLLDPEFVHDQKAVSDHEKLADVAKGLGYALSSLNRADFANDGHLSRTLIARGGRGILLRAQRPGGSYPQLDWNQFSVVVVGGSGNLLPFRFVRSDCFASVADLWSFAFARGYRRIACATMRHPIHHPDDQSRLGAALSCMEIHRESVTFIPPFQGLIRGPVDDFLKWYDQWRPDCVLGFNVNLYLALVARGVRVPEDVGFGLIQGSKQAFQRRGLTCMDMVGDELLEVGLRLLDEEIRLRRTGIPSQRYQTLLPPQLIIGRSLPDQA